eukprot:4918018-Amphidinium_carterae.3
MVVSVSQDLMNQGAAADAGHVAPKLLYTSTAHNDMHQASSLQTPNKKNLLRHFWVFYLQVEAYHECKLTALSCIQHRAMPILWAELAQRRSPSL